MILPSKELLSEVIGTKVEIGKTTQYSQTDYCLWAKDIDKCTYRYGQINIYELAHMNLKQWAKLKNVFGKIDWSEEPEQIFKKAEELRNEVS